MKKLKKIATALMVAAMSLSSMVASAGELPEGLYAFSLIGGNQSKDNMLLEIKRNGDFVRELWASPTDGYRMQNGWINNDGNLAGYFTLISDGELKGYKYQELDCATGKVLRRVELNSDMKLDYFSMCTYDPETNRIYGFGGDEQTWSCFKSVSPDDFSKPVIIRQNNAVNGSGLNFENVCCAICYNPLDKQLYGITKNTKSLVRIDKETGAYTTVVAQLPQNIRTNYNMGLVYLPNTDEYLWVAQIDNSYYSSYFYSIDANNGVCRLTQELPGSEVITFFVNMIKQEDKVPVRPEYISSDFINGSLSGSLKYKIPSKYIDGTDIVEDMIWSLSIDGAPVSRGMAEPGEVIDVNVVTTRGMHVFEMHVNCDDIEGPDVVKELFIGNDVPQAPSGVMLAEGDVSWNAVSKGVNGGYVDAANVTYEVYLDNNYLGETKNTTLTYNVDDVEVWSRHRAEVIAIVNDIESAPAYSNYAVYGKPINLAASFYLTEDEAALFFAANDPNARGIQWGYDEKEHALGTTMPWDTSVAWLISPPLYLDDPDVVYTFSFDCLRKATSSDSKFELSGFIGNKRATSAMSTQILDVFTPENGSYGSHDVLFSVPEAGVYYIGLKLDAAAISSELRLRNYTVKRATTSPDAPSYVTDVVATAAEKGALQATVDFKMPVSTILGQPIPSDAEITVIVTCTGTGDVHTVTGLPGSSQSVKVATEQNNNNIVLQSFISDKKGDKTSVNVFTGVDTPGMPGNLTATLSEDNMMITLTWSHPTVGSNGRYFTSNDITKYVLSYVNGFAVVQVGECPGTSTKVSYMLPDDFDYQSSFDFYLIPYSKAGAGTPAEVITVAGKPYKLPMNEHFEKNQIAYSPIYLSNPSAEYAGTQLFFQTPFNNNKIFERTDHISIGVFSVTEQPTKSMLCLPKFSTVGHEKSGVKVTFDIWTGQVSADEMILKAQVYGMSEPETIAVIPTDGTGWEVLTYELPEKFLGQTWVQLMIDSKYSKPDTFTEIYSYDIESKDPSGLDVVDVDSQRFITSTEHNVLFCGLEGQEFGIYTVDGRLLTAGKVTSDRMSVNVAPGLYVVRCADLAEKLVVR